MLQRDRCRKTKQEIVKGLEGLAYDAAESARHQNNRRRQDALLKLGGYAEAAGFDKWAFQKRE